MTHRRENGLLADAYVPLILLAPSHADHMLEALRRSGIAAYAVPTGEDVLEPALSSETDPPTDHLYVDAEERSAAERVLGTELPGLEGPEDKGADPFPSRGEAFPDTDGAAGGHGAGDAVGGDLLDGPLDGGPGTRGGSASEDPDDEVWQDLVARFYDTDTEPGRGAASWPDAENLDAQEREEPPPSRIGDMFASRSRRREEADEDKGEEEREAAERRAEAELEGHYEPPPPPPLIQGDRVGVFAWCGLLGAPALLFGSAFLGITLPNWVMLAAVVAFLAGFIVLILRMTDSRPPGDNGPDNGAVV